MNLLLENVHRDFAVVVADVNYLKTTNDTYGHSAGDQLLSYTANLLTETFKNSYVYRIGGDEFAIILDGVDYENRDELLEELNRKSIGSTIKVSENAEIAVSFAFGMATYTKELDAGFDDVLKHADSAMYLHKRTLKRAQLKAHPTEQQ
jgi:diguanylate cyclase (GGDEF)-like protein